MKMGRPKSKSKNKRSKNETAAIAEVQAASTGKKRTRSQMTNEFENSASPGRSRQPSPLTSPKSKQKKRSTKTVKRSLNQDLQLSGDNTNSNRNVIETKGSDNPKITKISKAKRHYDSKQNNDFADDIETQVANLNKRESHDGINTEVDIDNEELDKSEYLSTDDSSGECDTTDSEVEASTSQRDDSDDEEIRFRQNRKSHKKMSDYKDDPEFARYVEELVNKKYEAKCKKEGRKKRSRSRSRDRPGNNNMVRRENLIKSPSDTTLYAPAVNKQRSVNTVRQPIFTEQGLEKTINHISNFVEQVRIDSDRNPRGRNSIDNRKMVGEMVDVHDYDQQENTEEARIVADQAIITAEKPLKIHKVSKLDIWMRTMNSFILLAISNCN